MTTDTIFSFATELPRQCAEERASEGAEEGWMIHALGREHCRFVKICSGGAIVDFAGAVEEGQRLNLELTTGQRLAGIVAWQIGSHIYVKFEKPVDVFAMIARRLVDQPAERRRLPRIEMRCQILVASGTGTAMSFTRDISQQGISIETGLRLQAGEDVRMSLDDLPTLEGTARWSDDGVTGVEFHEELAWSRMMPWLKAARGDDTLPRSGADRPAHPRRAAMDCAAQVREGTRRWNVQVTALSVGAIEFQSFALFRPGTRLWVILPGLQGWSGTIVRQDRERYSCDFSYPLSEPVFERIVGAAQNSERR